MTDRTLYFDFLPLRVPRVRGMNVRLQLFTVPGQVYYAATRKLVLTGADGVVFVAERAGTVKLSAHGRAHCQPGQMCPQFVVAWTKTITVTTTGKAAQP